MKAVRFIYKINPAKGGYVVEGTRDSGESGGRFEGEYVKADVARELIETLERCASELNRIRNRIDVTDSVGEAEDLARAAIAKAEAK